MNVVAILRLASIIQTRASTYPAFDPTWYAAKPIVLAALETDLSTISAALPVFWPVLCRLPLNIVVTREINVTMEDRHLSVRGAAKADRDPEDDAVALQRSESGVQQPLQARGSRLNHYEDPYVAQQVSPLTKTEFGVTYEIGGLPNAKTHPGAK